jgi:hypothetical protein
MEMYEVVLLSVFALFMLSAWYSLGPGFQKRLRLKQLRTRDTWRAMVPVLSDVELRQVLRDASKFSSEQIEGEILLAVSEELQRRKQTVRVLKEWN